MEMRGFSLSLFCDGFYGHLLLIKFLGKAKKEIAQGIFHDKITRNV
jgi:hypothetical protein